MRQAWFFVHFNMTFYPDRVRITDARTGVTIDRTAKRPFSSEHRLLDDREVAAKFLHGVLREMLRNGSRGRSRMTLPMADVEIAEGPNSTNDQREVHKLLTDAGMVRIRGLTRD